MLQHRKLQILTEKCFVRCCQNTNGHLSDSEKKCLSNCHDAYFQAINVVADQINRLNSKAQER